MANRPRRLDNVLATMMSWQWAMVPERLQLMLDILDRAQSEPGLIDALEARRGQPAKDAHNMSVRDGVATIELIGPMCRYASWFTDMCGITSYDDIAADLKLALDDRSIRAIMLMCDTPGGEVNGASELAGMIRAGRDVKPVVAYVSNMAASAGFWLASASSRIVTAPTAVLGSVGVVATLRKYDERPGVKSIEIVSTQSPRKRLDPEQDDGRAAMLEVVDALAQVFIESLAAYRGIEVDAVLANYGQGGVFVGAAAVARGLADSLGTYEDTLAALQQDAVGFLASAPTGGTRATHHVPEDIMAQEKPEAGGSGASANAALPTTETTQGTGTPAPTKETVAAAAASEAPDPATAARAEERARITGIQALQKPGREKLIASCIADGDCTAAMAALRILEAEDGRASAKLANLKLDEEHEAKPASVAGAAVEEKVTEAAAGRKAAEMFHTLNPRARMRA
ncbi:MAG: ClpP class periplasmic serine protease [Gemmatimonadetes bacterium]|nr:ClpP class periplasmic serine protease [Gemmatimonadota bacterium]